MGRKQRGQGDRRGRPRRGSHESAFENGSQVTATMGRVHEGVQKIAFLVGVFFMVAEVGARHRIVAGLMQIAHGRQHRAHQHGQYQQPQRREAQQAGIATETGSMHGRGMLREPIAVMQSRARGIFRCDRGIPVDAVRFQPHRCKARHRNGAKAMLIECRHPRERPANERKRA